MKPCDEWNCSFMQSSRDSRGLRCPESGVRNSMIGCPFVASFFPCSDPLVICRTVILLFNSWQSVLL